MFLICAIISFLSHKSLSLSNIFSNDGYIHDPYQRYSVYNQQNQRHHHHDRDWLGTEPFILDSPQPRMIQSEPARWVDTMIYCPNFADKICEKLIKLCCIKGNCYIYNTFLLLLLLCLWLLPEAIAKTLLLCCCCLQSLSLLIYFLLKCLSSSRQEILGQSREEQEGEDKTW